MLRVYYRDPVRLVTEFICSFGALFLARFSEQIVMVTPYVLKRRPESS